MKDQVQSQIDRFLAFAKTPVVAAEHNAPLRSGATDSLSMLVKTKEDADMFMAMMEAAFKVAEAR